MAKTLYIDGVWTILHFNSGPDAYNTKIFNYSTQMYNPDIHECCYCHHPFEFYKGNIGEQQIIKCKNCKKSIVFLALYLNPILAEVLDIRGGNSSGRQLLSNAIMLITLPILHPEFERLIYNPRNFHRINEDKLILFAKAINSMSNILYPDKETWIKAEEYCKNNELFFFIGESLQQYGKIITFEKGDRFLEYDENFIDSLANELIINLQSEFPRMKLSKKQHQQLRFEIIERCLEYFLKKYPI